MGSRTHLNEAGQMVVEGIGRLSALMYNEKPAVHLTVDNELLTEGIGGQQIVMSLVMSSSGRESYGSVCPGQ